MEPRGATRWVLVAISAVLLVFAALPARARADVPSSPGDRGDCGAEGLVCQKKEGDRRTAGICRKSRLGEVFCATDEDSARRAAELLAARAERSRKETIWGVGGLAAFAVALVATVALLRRRKVTPPAP